MALAIAGIPGTPQRSEEIVKFSNGAASFADLFFGFLVEGHNSSDNSFNLDDHNNEEEDDQDEDENPCNVEENKAFWKEQEQLLQGTLYRTSSIETKIRQAIKEALRVISTGDNQCVCWPRPVAGGCRNCLRSEICNWLINGGFNCSICKSKWRSKPDIPSGEHTYLEVLDKSNPKKGEVRVVIEINFQAEFEMARASEEYNRLISRLPEVFVGKSERLRGLIKILCWAAKKCTKEKKMHLGPWRKHKYMEAKWLGTCERMTPAAAPLLSLGFSDRQPKARASMLTFDLLDTLPGLRCSSTAVEVV